MSVAMVDCPELAWVTKPPALHSAQVDTFVATNSLSRPSHKSHPDSGALQVDTFVAMDKVYSGTLRLGEATPSFDAETDVSERRPWEHLTDADLTAARDGFLGDTTQLPPMYSAIRIKGAL